ncbi:MAG: DUF1501 domain-containing protein, partial [Candidatus Hydrogenedentes bacterium]|nr:DUF1501 domain-containing protein [Candidatus Hydrogenedentota bacterium]
MTPKPIQHRVLSRRELLGRFANGFGMLGLAGLLAEAAPALVLPRGANPLTVKAAHYAPRAKNIIFL